MKTLSLAVIAGTIYATLAVVIASALGGGLGGDDKLALFLIGFGVGVFTSKRLGWID